MFLVVIASAGFLAYRYYQPPDRFDAEGKELPSLMSLELLDVTYSPKTIEVELYLPTDAKQDDIVKDILFVYEWSWGEFQNKECGDGTMSDYCRTVITLMFEAVAVPIKEGGEGTPFMKVAAMYLSPLQINRLLSLKVITFDQLVEFHTLTQKRYPGQGDIYFYQEIVIYGLDKPK